MGALNRGTADDGPYGQFNQEVAATTVGGYEGPAAKLGGGPDTVAKAIEKAVTAKRPKARYPVTPSARHLPGPGRARRSEYRRDQLGELAIDVLLAGQL